MNVVGICFIKNGKLLVSKSRTSRGFYTLVGGKVKMAKIFIPQLKENVKKKFLVLQFLKKILILF